MKLDKTITSIFIAPTLGIDLKLLKSNNYINGFSIDSYLNEQYENAVYLLFNPSNINKFRIFVENEYERTDAIVDDYDYQDGYVVLVYTLDLKYDSDFKLIREGKYSETSKEFQGLFPSVNVDSKEEKSIQYRIFNKTQDLVVHWEDIIGTKLTKDQEHWSGFDINKETLKL